MELTKYAQAIKNQLSFELSKSGSSLEEFETYLENLNTGEGAYKVAAITTKLLAKEAAPGPVDMAYDFAKGLPEFAMKGSLGIGAAAGLSMDEMDKSVDSVNRALDREREKVTLVRRLTENLKREHGIV